MTLLLGIPTVLVLWYGGRQVIAGTLTIGGATQFILYLGMLAGFVSRLGTLATMISRTISAGGRIFEILDTESAVKEKPGAIELGTVKGAVSFRMSPSATTRRRRCWTTSASMPNRGSW